MFHVPALPQEANAPGKHYEWQLSDGQQWLMINNDHIIECNYCQPGAKGITIDTDHGSLRIDFDDMTISGPFANLAVRRLSFMPENQTEDIGWYYRDNSHWREYGGSSLSSQDIEQKYNVNPTGFFQFTFESYTYKLDFSGMTQTNLSTYKQRKMRRRPKFNSIVYVNHSLNTSQQSTSTMNQFPSATASANPSTRVTWEFMGDEGMWTEYQKPGDKEAELGLTFSPLCDRKSTMVPQSQIGFIDFIVEPTFTVLSDMAEKVMTPLIDEASRSGLASFRRSSLNNIPSDGKRANVKSTSTEGSTAHNGSLLSVDIKSFKSTWTEEVHQNREKWKTQAAKEEKVKKEEEEKANEKETDRKQDTSEEKMDTTQDKGKTEKEAKEKSPNKDMKDSSFTDRNTIKLRDTKPEPTDSSKVKADKKEPREQQPKEVEGNKDPGGVNGRKPEAANEQVDAKELDTSSDADNSQQVQNGEELDLPDSDGSHTKSSDDADEEHSTYESSAISLVASAAAASTPDAH